MTEKRAARCEVCRFAEPVDNRVLPQVECRRSAPIMVLKRSSCASYWAPGWPAVGVQEWCGEFEPARAPARSF